MAGPVDQPRSLDERAVALGAATGGVGAALAAIAASACCVGPAVVSILGVGGAVAAAGLAPYRAYLLMASFALLAVGFWLSYWPPGRAGASYSTAQGPRVRRVLWSAAVLTVFAVVVPYLVASP